MFLISRLAIVALLLGIATPAFAFTDKSIRDWYGSCDDQFNCRLQTQPVGDDIYTIEFSRTPEANAAVSFSLSHRGVLKEGSMIGFAVPGHLDRFALPVSSGSFANGRWKYEVPQIESVLVPALRAGDEVTISIETDIGSFSETASLSGSSGVMLWMDEQQNRIDRTDALVAAGNRPATGRQTRSSTLKSRSDLPQSVVAQWKIHPGQCESDFNGESILERFSGTRINIEGDGKVSVYILPCGGPGAYNIIHAGFVHDKETGEARPLFFASMFDQGPGVLSTIINAGWNDDQGQLYAFAKGRGLGDCGTESAWEWDGNGIWGSFILVEERSKSDCDGDYETPWPQVWPVR